ncbi:flagellar biosynthetic protein FliR [Melioribacteraceae bacterium 4301-Me]|uniref:flagellar biosynthetic protein FliR n=1 Tax=Pyranulibacter aquaticus TaxID=3163344 RepID=UPI003594EB3A
MNGVLQIDFVIFFLIFLRIISAFVAAPVLGNSAVPVVTKIFLSILIAYILFFVLPKATYKIELNLWFIVINAIKEIITGLIIGFTLNLLFYGISFAGSIMGFDVGLSASQVLNPFDETENDVIGQALYFLAMLIFLLINGHHYIIKALDVSFRVVPLGKYVVNESLSKLLIKYSGAVFVIAIKIASPILVSFFILHIAEGILSRVIPQMQVFFVTQPLKIGLGFLILSLSVPLYVYVIKSMLRSYEDSLYQIIKAMGA